MGKELFGAASLARIDEGRVKATIDKHIAAVAADIDDRGEDGETRKVVITIAFKPLVSGGQVYETQAEIDVQSTRPSFRSKPYSMACKRSGQGLAFVYNEAASDNINQGTLDDAKKG